MDPQAHTLENVRGCVVGASSGVTAILAHSAAGGGLPDTTALTLLVAVCAGLGWTAAVTATSKAGRPGLVGMLVAGQVVGHLSLVALSHHHATLFTPSMATFHVAATVVAAASALGLESALSATLSVVIRTVLTLISSPVDDSTAWSVLPADDDRLRPGRRHVRPVGTRGPPAAAI
ncbi:hypothetical protein GTV32_08195 [Gordonia sp. SID5947]|uniref:hypothetical protein n=1 Tax=Gordonia sp. SID5947 TaxID=2690315 RepID=UPI00136D06DE|nr:hypothetical protein [Gordonia sp. SID5947]MYR06296.1 hypothetical protein [Gordonia sp. SID5947]